jgi:TM2 domain-containing membrane protein YozV
MSYCNRTHGIPALFSFFIPGLGQLVKGDILKALFIWIAFIITGPVHFIGFGLPIWFIIWVWQLYDAYNS